MLDSLAAAAARLFSTLSRFTPCLWGRTGFGRVGATRAAAEYNQDRYQHREEHK